MGERSTMIGRIDDLARLRIAVTGDGAPRAVFLDGAIGVGKTALLTTLLADPALPRALFSRAAERPAPIPLDGIRGILEGLLDADLPALLSEGSSLRTLRRRVREALATAPTLLVVDDAHWLDRDSIELLTGLLSAPLPAGTAFLFVHRTGLISDLIPHAAARGGLPLSRVALGPLDDDAARALLSRYGADDPEILRLAAGNPLFLRLLAEGSPLGGPDDGDELTATGLGSLDDTLRIEISALPTAARVLLHALSLAPAPAPSALPALTGLSDAELLEASDRLAAHGLSDPQQLEILHPLIRAAAYRDMTPAARRRLHRIAAAHVDGLLEQAAHLHHLGAHLTADELRTLKDAATSVLASAPRSARTLLEKTRRIPDRDRDLLLARALLLDGQPRDAEELLRTLHTQGDESKEAAALLLQSLRIQSRPDEAVELVREITDWARHPEVAVEAATLMVMHEGSQDPALITQAAGASPGPGVAAALSALAALAHLRHGDVALARGPYEAARDGFLSIAASDLLPVIDAVTAAGWSAHMVGDFEGGIAFVERAVLLAERNGRFHALPHLYCILAFLHIPLDHPAETEELVEQAIDAAERYDWPDVIPLATTAALVAAPDRDAAERRYRTLAALEPPRTWWWRQVVELFRARIEIRFGLPTDTAVLRADDDDVFGIQKRIGLGELALARGDIAEAHAHAARTAAMAERFGVPYLTGQSTLFLAEVLHADGRPTAARAAAVEAAAQFTAAGAPLYARGAQAWLRRHAPERTDAAPSAPADPLTARELGVAELAADGLSNREIAARLHLSTRTVESHIASILRKRGLRSRAGLARSLDGVG